VLEAIKGGDGVVLLIDEIDKADTEFEAFLLEVLSEFSVSIPEIGTISASTQPMIFLTSNNSREVSDALKRRCLYLYMDIPDRDMVKRIILTHKPDIKDRLITQVLNVVDNIRKLNLNRQPSVGEIVDWVRSLIVLSAKDIDRELFVKTMSSLIKDRQDINAVRHSLNNIIR